MEIKLLSVEYHLIVKDCLVSVFVRVNLTETIMYFDVFRGLSSAKEDILYSGFEHLKDHNVDYKPMVYNFLSENWDCIYSGIFNKVVDND